VFKLTNIENVKDAIKTAIQMEKDGYSFYKKAAAQTSSEMGKTIFEGIAKDEQTHLEVFQKMFEETVGKTEWDELVQSSKKYADLPIFPKDLKTADGIEPDANELDALNFAMNSEKEAIDFYNKIRDSLSVDEVIKILDEIIEQEKNHYQILEQEFHHLNETGFWYELTPLGE